MLINIGILILIFETQESTPLFTFVAFGKHQIFSNLKFKTLRYEM